MENILQSKQIIRGTNIKVTRYMNEAELTKYIDKSRRCRVYIKRLPTDFNNEKLLELFSIYGEISKAYCVSGTKSRKKYKYGYVLFENEQSIELLPREGIPYKNIHIRWTCHKFKSQKRKTDKRKKGWRSQIDSNRAFNPSHTGT